MLIQKILFIRDFNLNYVSKVVVENKNRWEVDLKTPYLVAIAMKYAPPLLLLSWLYICNMKSVVQHPLTSYSSSVS